MKKVKQFYSILLIIGLLVLSACGGGGSSTQSNTTPTTTSGEKEAAAGESYTFKLTHITQTSHVWHKTAEKFGEELEKLSNGRMKLEVFPAGQLGQEQDMVSQMVNGTIDFGFITNAYMSSRNEALNAWFMPFLFNNLEEVKKARESETAKTMLGQMDEQGLVGLDFMFTSNHHLLMKAGAIKSANDLVGKKIRITGSPAIKDFWAAVGAVPTPMPLPEVYTSLQTGVIEGISIDTDAMKTEKFQEIAKDLTLTNQMAFPAVVVASKVNFEKLSAEDQAIVEEAMKNAIDWGIEEAIKNETANIEELKGMGVNVYELEDAASFEKVKEEVYSKYSSNPLIKQFIEENSAQ